MNEPRDDGPADQPDLADVLEPTEHAIPDHREHAKTPKHLNDDELERRTEREREEVGADDEFDSRNVPPAAE